MVIFFTLIAIIQVLSGYVCAKGIYCITKKTWLSVIIVFLSVAVFLSFGDFRNSLKCIWLIDFISDVSYFYLGFTLYFSICCIVTFIVHKFGIKMNLRKILSIELVGVALLLFAGYINAINPRLRKLSIPANINLKICFVSDIHIGSINTITILNKIYELIEHANPDIVILGGDTIDKRGYSDYSVDFINIMRRISSKYKTYAIIGNHELYTGPNDCINLLKKAGISVLLDRYIILDNIIIVGRLDSNVYYRKSLQELIPENAKNVIIVDHEPDSIDESVRNNVLLHLSGHTHAGQMFPINLVTNFIYKPTGILSKIKNTYFYITNGAGFWGPPYRIGNIPEVVLIKFGK